MSVHERRLGDPGFTDCQLHGQKACLLRKLLLAALPSTAGCLSIRAGRAVRGAEEGCCGALDCEQLTPHHVMHLGQLPKLGHCKGYLRQGSLIELVHRVWGYVKRQGW